jgi:hypothetical protein
MFFDHQPLATTLYVFPRFTVSIYPFSIFRLFSNSSSSRGYLNLFVIQLLYKNTLNFLCNADVNCL